MKLPQLLDLMIHQSITVSIAELHLDLLTIERDLQVLGSQFCPDLHELNAEINELRQRIEHYAFHYQRDEDGADDQDPPAPPAG